MPGVPDGISKTASTIWKAFVLYMLALTAFVGIGSFIRQRIEASRAREELGRIHAVWGKNTIGSAPGSEW
jgi:hypothetical protein